MTLDFQTYAEYFSSSMYMYLTVVNKQKLGRESVNASLGLVFVLIVNTSEVPQFTCKNSVLRFQPSALIYMELEYCNFLPCTSPEFYQRLTSEEA